MKATWRRVGCAVFALAFGAACGSSGGAGTSPVVGGGGDGGGDVAPARCEEVTIRLSGVRPGAVSALGLVLDRVAASRKGSALPVVMDVPPGSTLDTSEATDLGRFAVAEGDDAISVSISFSGGSATRDELVGLGLCSGPIEFTFSPARLDRERCRAHVVLDVGRSAVPNGGTIAFIPQYQLFF